MSISRNGRSQNARPLVRLSQDWPAATSKKPKKPERQFPSIDPEKFKIIEECAKRFVLSYRAKYPVLGKDLDDWKQELLMTGCYAFPKYDEAQGTKLPTFLNACFMNKTMDLLRAMNEGNRRLSKKCSIVSASQSGLPDEINDDVFFPAGSQAYARDPKKIEFINSIFAGKIINKRQREILFLHYFAQLTFLQISEFLDLSIGTIKSSFSNAARSIRQAYPDPASLPFSM
jgi:RNA polymerase sigma factor (sigma-70 family)